jgi:putative photosynthetic complex assembly protein 2
VLSIALAIGFALFLWWFATGLILFLDGLPRRTFRWSMLVASAILLLAFAGLWLTRDTTTVAGAYLAFTCAILVWGWNEMAFLMGIVTGPRKIASPPGVTGWTRTRHAIEAILHHELAILASGAAVYLLTMGGENRIGILTFAVLWGMRLSTKLNLHLGVPNHAAEFLPEHLRYLQSWFTTRPINPLFPVSITVSTLVLAYAVMAIAHPLASDFEVAGYGLVAALLALAILEHWFLVLPIPVVKIWGWGLSSRSPRLLRSARLAAGRASLSARHAIPSFWRRS